MDDADRRVAELEALVASLQEMIAELQATIPGHETWMTDLERGIGDVREAHGTQLADLSKWLNSTVLTVSAMSTAPIQPSPTLQRASAPAGRADDVDAVRRTNLMWTVMAFLEAAPVMPDTLVSVVMPTRNRSVYLARAIDSVLAQRHERWELIVVDDGSSDATPELLAAIDDPRVRTLRTDGVGEAASRNLALDTVSGELVTYLDDDNLMHRGWLRAVAWAFDRWPAIGLLYGARIIEDAPAMHGRPSGALPNLDWEPFDRVRLEQMNYIDMNTIAHRSGLDGCRFDETLESSLDWQLALDFTAAQPPFELPAIACFYGTYAPGRVCDSPARLEANRRVRARVHKTRPMRVLSHNAMFPLISETYILEEMLALERNGAEIAFSAAEQSVSPFPLQHDLWHDLPAAVREFDPDVLVLYWATHAEGELANLEKLGRPFALRSHSFDFDVERINRISAHALCVGVWAYPHQVPLITNARPLVPLFVTHESMPEPAAGRDLVISVSAGLPKKDWPFLFEVMDRLDHLERCIVLARTNGFEEVPDEVAVLASKCDRPPTVLVNAPRSEVFELMSRTSVFVYTLEDGASVGMPMSLIEAMRAGACIVHPDREELRGVVGDGFRGYRDVDDVVSHASEIAAGGPAIDAERAKNREWALTRFCDPDLGRRFHQELSDALEAWRYRVG